MLGILLSLITLMFIVFICNFYWVFLVGWCFILSLVFLIKVHIVFDYFSLLGYTFDLLSLIMIGLRVWILGLIFLARKNLWIIKGGDKIFSLLCLILGVALLLAFGRSSLLRFYIFFEASLIPTFLLVLGWGYQPERLQAGIYLLLYTISASLPLLLSIGLINKVSFRSIFFIPRWEIVFLGGVGYGW